MIRLDSVSFGYSLRTPWERTALDGVDLDIGAGERILVCGGNGSGKTTLAWILAGLLSPTEGQALLDGSPIAESEGQVGLGFQHARLQLFRPTVAADVRFGTGLGDAQLDELLNLVGLPPPRYRDARIDALSGGELRRVALAGLLVRRPRLLVLDEPFAGLDAPARERLVEVVERLQRSSDTATVIISHDIAETAPLADRAIVLHEGRVVHDGALPTPERDGHLAAGMGEAPVREVPGASVRVGARSGRRPRASLADLHLFRYLPGTSPLQRARPGPKLMATVVLGVCAAVVPTWTTVAVLAVVAIAAALAARVPAGAFPRVPGWVGIALGISGGVAALAGGDPLGLGGFLDWLRLTSLGILALAFGFLLGWTTRASDLAPSVGRGLAPMRLLRVPVDEITAVLALAVRCMPLLFEEMRTLSAAYRLRRYRVPAGFRDRIVFVHDLLVTALTTSVRRASEMARAMTVRGGPFRSSSGRRRLGPADLGVMVTMAVAVAAILLL